MGWRRRAGGGRRDVSEKAILRALQAAGCETWQLSGTGCPDVLVRFRGLYYVFEVKTGKGRKTANQADIPWPVISTPEDALQHLGAEK